MIKNKKAAMEMSVGTIVTIVLLMTVLILGLVLTRTIFSGAKYNIQVIDEKIRGEIEKLFAEDKPLVVYLPNQKADLKQGEEWGIAWAVKNMEEGTTESSSLTYEILASDASNCGGLTVIGATNYILIGQSESQGIPLRPGQVQYEIARVNIPSTAPICTIRYRIKAKLARAGRQDVDLTSFFDVKIKA